MTTRSLARMAARAAARLRADLGIGPADTVCPFDVADDLGVVTRLASLPSLEGMYSPGDRCIVLSSERPPGRRRQTCAHELGHHVFDHGLRLDQLVEDAANQGWEPEEFVAHRFAVGLLMPKLGVEWAITRRGWWASALTPEQAFVVSQDLGVGYANFVRHLERTLCLITEAHSEQLRREANRLPRLRSSIAGFQVDHDLLVADQHWGVRPIDLDVGDVVLVPGAVSFTGCCVSLAMDPVRHLRAVAAGQGSLNLRAGREPAAIRVSRRNFTGLARYRHMEDPADGS